MESPVGRIEYRFTPGLQSTDNDAKSNLLTKFDCVRSDEQRDVVLILSWCGVGSSTSAVSGSNRRSRLDKLQYARNAKRHGVAGPRPLRQPARAF